MLDCWKTNPELHPSFLFLKHKAEEMIQYVNENYPNLDFDLNDCLPHCNLQMTSEIFSIENIIDDYKQGEEIEKENNGTS